ncbi:FAD-binding oxidoreductase [Streptomyces sp. IB201691-2A2]|uniref:FAD-binding oxidoreductase n=1 Tax=Streptomyces sp. IB201691-2A2 TaxID=2561920 RepID=UPI00117F3BF2|nr:FAD-binding oxidoreductase [Streptomyces sp. IB201691-2A2]TRO55732.1 FAD-binding oxidoreductase [Streptomyces sp. IB201691-2A2]
MTELDLTILRTQVEGPVLTPGDPGYAVETATYNLLTPMAPAVVVGAATLNDVQCAVHFAAEHGLAVAVRGGGHLQPRTGAGQLALTLDRMTSVEIDPVAETVRVTGSPRWTEVIDAAVPHGLAPVSGSTGTTGVVGYLLGGGMSPILGRSYGYGSDHITEIEIVTADGVHRTCSPTTEPDLFEMLRGSKGNAGVVVAMTFSLIPLVGPVTAGGVWFAGERAAEVLPVWRDWAQTLPESATTSVAIQRLPALSDIPYPIRGAFVVHVRFSSIGDPDDAAKWIMPIRELGAPLMDTVGDLPYAESWTIHADPQEPLPYLDRSMGLGALSDDTITALLGQVGPGTGCDLVSVELRVLGGALDRPPAAPDVVPTRGLPYQLFAFGVGGRELFEHNTRQLDGMIDAVRPWDYGPKMVNFVSPEEGLTPAHLAAIYGPHLYERVVALKERFDPHNMFRINHNLVAG